MLDKGMEEKNRRSHTSFLDDIMAQVKWLGIYDLRYWLAISTHESLFTYDHYVYVHAMAHPKYSHLCVLYIPSHCDGIDCSQWR